MSRYSVPICAISLIAFALTFSLTADDKKSVSRDAEIKHTNSHEDCSQSCGNCFRVCEMCAAHCAKMLADGKKEHLATLHSCQDCATVCSAAASIVARKGPFSEIICMSCVDACKQCAIECEKLSSDPMMKKCAEDCRKCEKACQEMLNRTIVK